MPTETALRALRSLEAFLRELPVPLARAGPMLPTPRNAGDLEALVGMQQLQLTFVYGKVLSKKTRVRASDPLLSLAAAPPSQAGCASLVQFRCLLRGRRGAAPRLPPKLRTYCPPESPLD